MSKYYVVFERPDGDTLKRDGYVFEFEHEYPTEEELINAMREILGGTDNGTIIFMQKLYSEDVVESAKDITGIGAAFMQGFVEGLAPIDIEAKEEENAEQQ